MVKLLINGQVFESDQEYAKSLLMAFGALSQPYIEDSRTKDPLVVGVWSEDKYEWFRFQTPEKKEMMLKTIRIKH